MIDFKKKMEELENLESQKSPENIDESLIISPKKKKIRVYVISFIVIALVFSGKIIMSSQNATSWLPGINFFNRILNLAPIADKQLEGEENDRVNILLLGMGGEFHEAGNLTDTMIIASLKPSTKQASLISLPRDLTSPVNGWRKINSINAYAEKEESGSGGEVTTESISDLLQIPIPYYVRIDFNGFKKIIDELGGVEIEVENSFIDYMYPIAGQEDNPDYYSRFEKLSFTKGLTKMDGKLALKYARSRHALGIEGSDFSRAKRQQLLIEAVKEKIFSRQTLLNPVFLGKLINELNKNLKTNLTSWELVRTWELFKDLKKDQIINQVLNDAPDNYLVAGKGEDGAYILTPKTGNFSEIKKLIQNIFDSETRPSEEIRVSSKTDSRVYIVNGTWINGLASNTAANLISHNFQIIGTGNANERNYADSVIYDLSYGKNNDDLLALKKITGATQAFNSPDWLEEYKIGDNKSDFLLILGTNANK